MSGEERTQQEQRQESERLLFIGAKRALIGGLLAGGVVIGGQLLVGRIYSETEARKLIEALVPSARTLGSGVVGATSTILALMLTMLSLSRHATSELESVFFKRVKRIGLLSTIALVVSSLLLLLLSLPLQESKNVPGFWFSGIYYALIGLTAGITGLFVAIVLMLYNALGSLIKVLRPPTRSRTGSKASPSQGLGGKVDPSPAPQKQRAQKRS
ncbi:MAG: hypothetical protein ACLFU8_17795 [Anaerolineales bacterium]